MGKHIAVIVFFFISLTAPAYGAQPIETLEKLIQQVIGILNDAKYQDASKADQQQKDIWKATQKGFDFELISKLALGKYRKRFSKPELKEFTNLFTELLGDTYIIKLQEGFKNEKVTYLSQDLISDVKARVKTIVIRKGVDVPVDYSMRLRDSKWRVYDIKIEGVSLVKNYRTQFNTFLLKKSPAKLITHLKEKGGKKTE